MKISKILTLFLLIAGLLPAARAQGIAKSPLDVSMRVLLDGSILPNDAYVPLPAAFFLHPDVNTTLPVRAGETVKIDFFADGHLLTSAKAAWHDASVPPLLPGQSHPMYRVPAQFVVPNYIWTNAPAGSHVLSIHAYDFHGYSASPPPLHVTVLPPLPRQPVTGTRVLTGKIHPALKPEQVRIASALPAVAYDLIGTVSARASGIAHQDAEDAFAELKKQAASMGANCVVIGRVLRNPGTPFSVGRIVFSPPDTRVSGKALFVPSYSR